MTTFSDREAFKHRLHTMTFNRESAIDSTDFKMEGHAENARVGRGEGVDWIVKESFETEAEMKAYCTENFLARGRTNHNIGKRVTYLTCAMSK